MKEIYQLSLAVLSMLVPATQCNAMQGEPTDPTVKNHILAVIKSIANSDSVTFSRHVSYPLSLPSVKKPVANQKEMQQWFTRLFSKSYRQQMAKSNLGNWSEMGWRGWMYNDGDIWVDSNGVIAINITLKNQSASAPSTSSNTWQPNACYQDLRNGSIYRVDYNAKGDKCRIRIYPKGSTTSTTPQVLTGKVEMQGTMHNVVLTYEGTDKSWMLNQSGNEDGIPTFSFTQGKTDYDHELATCDFKEVMKARNQGKATLIGHWYLPADKKVSMDFSSDSTFVFTDYNDRTERYERLTGTFRRNGEKLVLQYKDRKAQTFTYHQAAYASESYIKKGNNYCLIKQ